MGEPAAEELNSLETQHEETPRRLLQPPCQPLPPSPPCQPLQGFQRAAGASLQVPERCCFTALSQQNTTAQPDAGTLLHKSHASIAPWSTSPPLSRPTHRSEQYEQSRGERVRPEFGAFAAVWLPALAHLQRRPRRLGTVSAPPGSRLENATRSSTKAKVQVQVLS